MEARKKHMSPFWPPIFMFYYLLENHPTNRNILPHKGNIGIVVFHSLRFHKQIVVLLSPSSVRVLETAFRCP